MTDEPNFKGRITTVEAATLFTLAGNATITLVSKRTGARFTYKVQRKAAERPGAERPAFWFVKVLTGADNENSFEFLGTIKPAAFMHGKKSRIKPQAPSAMAFAWFWGRLVAAKALPDDLEIWHEGKCGRCGRKLTVPESIATGFGPDCVGLMASPKTGGF
jgi:hypothetical protein